MCMAPNHSSVDILFLATEFSSCHLSWICSSQGWKVSPHSLCLLRGQRWRRPEWIFQRKMHAWVKNMASCSKGYYSISIVNSQTGKKHKWCMWRGANIQVIHRSATQPQQCSSLGWKLTEELVFICISWKLWKLDFFHKLTIWLCSFDKCHSFPLTISSQNCLLLHFYVFFVKTEC